MDSIACQYYLRFMAEDKPGVLGRIASVLGRHKISIASMIQQGRAPEVSVPVVMRTHESYERNLTLALAEIRRRKIVKAEPVFIRIEEQL
jgi:homoserine dehydrogenase